MIKLLENKKVRLLLCVLLVMLIAVVVIQPTYAAGNVSGVIQNAWKSAETQSRMS